MRVYELLETLERMPDQNAEVLMACQPGYPLQFEIEGAIAVQELVREEEDPYAELCEHGGRPCEECYRAERLGEYGNVVWIVQGEHPRSTPYTTTEVWSSLSEVY